MIIPVSSSSAKSMSSVVGNGSREQRRCGSATAELAILLPFLCFLFVISIDFARIFYYAETISTAAVCGAEYGAIDIAHTSDTAGIKKAATDDGTTLKPALAASDVQVTTDNQTYVTVTVTYQFASVVNYSVPPIFSVPPTLTMTRTVTMLVPPDTPSFN
jgi:Flp pilus assembly protein TadG